MVYAYQPVSPLNAFAQSFQLAQGIRQTQQAEQAKLDEMRMQKANQAAFVQDVNAWRMNPTREAWAELQIKYPQLAVQAKPLADLYGERGKEAIVDVGARFLTTQGEGRKQVLEQAVLAAENSRMPETASLFKQALQMYETNPDAAEATIRAALIKENGDVYDRLFKRADPTAFQQDFEFIKDRFGEGAAAEFAQFGRGGAPVSIPLGNNQMYVGPAALAPGVRRWQEQGAPSAGAAPSSGEATPEQVNVLRKAETTKSITPEEAEVVRASLGPKGRAAFEDWMRKNNIVVSRTIGGKTYYQVNGKWYDNPEGR